MIRGATALLAGVLAVTGCGSPAGPADPGGGGSWAELPAPPLSPRTGAATAWTGTEALFLGGDTGPPCLDAGSTADCEVPPGARDGAAFDPVARAWRRIAEAPVPIQGYQPSAVSGDTVYLATAEQLLAYDASDDAWTARPLPGDAPEYGRLAVVVGGVVLVGSERRAGEPSGYVFDPASGTWAVLPDDPLGPAYDRVPTATSNGLVLTGKRRGPSPGATEPSLVRAAVIDSALSSRWIEVELGEQIGGRQWAWTGVRMVDPTLGRSNGGEGDNWGRDIPMGGVLDPASGTWRPLPSAPGLADNDGWGVEALGGPLSAVSGWVYDDRVESWTLLAPPSGAPPTPGSAVWAGDRLVVLGGVDPAEGSTLDALSGDAWMWTPGDAGVDEGLAGAWALLEATSGDRPVSIPADSRTTLVFASGAVGGSSFCNGYRGSYRPGDDGDLTLDGVTVTEVACEGPAATAERAYFDVLLASGLTAAVDGADLLLTSDAGELRFLRLPAVPVGELTGIRWVLESVTADGESTPATGAEAFLSLSANGLLAAGTGCQNFATDWRSWGDTVRIGEFGWFAPECAGAAVRQDETVVGTLRGGFVPAVDGDVLTVTAARRPTVVLTYRAG